MVYQVTILLDYRNFGYDYGMYVGISVYIWIYLFM